MTSILLTANVIYLIELNHVIDMTYYVKMIVTMTVLLRDKQMLPLSKYINAGEIFAFFFVLQIL